MASHDDSLGWLAGRRLPKSGRRLAKPGRRTCMGGHRPMHARPEATRAAAHWPSMANGRASLLRAARHPWAAFGGEEDG